MCVPKPNISKDQAKAFKDLGQNKDGVMLTVDKGVAMVVLDRQDCISKDMDLLADRDTYRPLTDNPTNKHKNKLINMLRTIKA